MLTRLKAHLSPALVISLIALFVSLGGAGYAAVTVTGKDVKNSSLTGKDVKNSSLTGKDVKNSSLTGKDVKNRSMSGADVKDDGLGGTQILESRLGKVPSASTADTAGRAGSAATVDKLKTVGSYKKVVSSASDNNPDTARTNATEVPLLTVGSFDVYAKCFTNATAPATLAEVYIRARENNSIFTSIIDGFLGNPFLSTGTAETDRQLATATAAANSVSSLEGYHQGFFAAAPSGSTVDGNTEAVAKNGTLAGGDGIYGAGNACVINADALG